MERRLNTESKGGSITLQKKLLAERRRKLQPAPDLSDFMTDMFFGTADMDKKSYDLSGGAGGCGMLSENEDDVGFDDSTRSNSSRMTEEWLEEARRVVAASPTRCDSPRRLVGSPRFVAAAQGTSPAAFPLLDKRDPLSRSARRNRAGEGFSGEILSKTTKHSRNDSDTLLNIKPSSFEDDKSPATAVHRWFSNILKPANPTISSDPSPAPDYTQPSSPLPPRRSFNRRSRFQTDPSVPPPQGDQVFSRRNFRSSAPSPEPPALSPPRNVGEPAVLRALSSSKSLPLSPPRDPVQSVHRRRLSSSTCSLEKVAPGTDAYGQSKQEERTLDHSLNRFLEEQRILIQKVMNMELNAQAKIVLSGPSNSVTSMVAAICYAWLLWYRQKEKDDGGDNVVVPVINVKRSSMLKLRQAAWLFFLAGLDATSLLFADEVDLEDRMMSGRLNIYVVGQDILSGTGEVGSKCTILTDNYCEDAYDLLQDPVLQKLLLSGILLDTQNLKASASSSMTRDSEAVRLLLVGSAPNYRFTLFDQLMQEQRDASFIEALHQNYRKASDRSDQDYEGNPEQRVQERKLTAISNYEVVMPRPEKNSTSTRGAKTNKASPQPAKVISPPEKSPAPARTEKEASRGKNVFFLAKWFGFGSK